MFSRARKTQAFMRNMEQEFTAIRFKLSLIYYSVLISTLITINTVKKPIKACLPSNPNSYFLNCCYCKQNDVYVVVNDR